MKKAVLALFAFFAVGVVSAYGDSFVQVATPTGADTINWGQLGAPPTTVPSPASWTSNLGATGTVSDSGTLERVDEGNDWVGVFTLGDHLLFNLDNGNTIDVHFNSPISGGGAQIQNNLFGTYTGYIQAMGSFGLSPIFQVSGNNTFNEDGSAPFIGIQDLSGGNITDLLFTTTSTSTGGGCNNCTAIDAVTFSAVPEPGTLSMLGLGLLGLGAKLRRRRKS